LFTGFSTERLLAYICRMHRIFFQGLLVLLLVTACRSNGETVKPVIQDITEAVYASGNVKAKDEYKVYATVTGLIGQIFVSKGDLVKKGQPLFVISNDNPELNAENARLAYELAKENYQGSSDKLEELRLQVQTAKEKYLNDSLQFFRQKNLWDQQIGTQNDLDQRKLAFDMSRNNYLSAVSRLEQVRVQLKHELDRAYNNFQMTRNTKRDYTINSEMDGRVYDLYREKGELAGPQQPVALIGRAGDFIIELLVDEYDIARLRTGQQVIVTMDSYKGQAFEAAITRIHPLMNERTRSFTVEAVFTRGPEILYPNLSVEANIVIQTKQNALTIPLSFLVDDNYVLVEDNQKKKVETGIRDLQRVEITSGLDTAGYIFKP
jgi:HlyD family secretion protein